MKSPFEGGAGKGEKRYLRNVVVRPQLIEQLENHCDLGRVNVWTHGNEWSDLHLVDGSVRLYNFTDFLIFLSRADAVST